jgi:hypothetical protein
MPRESNDRAVQFISKLVQLTQDRKLDWESRPSPKSKEQAAFFCEVAGKKLRLYRFSEQVPNPEYDIYTAAYPSTFITLGSRPPEPSRTKLIHGTVLEVLDESGRASYTFENKTGLSDLYESAAYSASKVDQLIDSVLATA